MRSTMIKCALIAAMLAAGAFTATTASAFSQFGGVKGGLGNRGGDHFLGQLNGLWAWGSRTGLDGKYSGQIRRVCINQGHVGADGNPVVTNICRTTR